MPNPTDYIAKQVVARAPDIVGIETALAKQVRGMMNILTLELTEELKRVDPTAPQRSAYQMARLKKLNEGAKSIIDSNYRAINVTTHKELTSLALNEDQWMAQTINDAVKTDIISVTTTTALAKELARNTLIQGAPSAEWWKRQALSTQIDFMDAMRQGVLRGETLSQLVQRIRGTRAASFKDGIMNISTRHAETLARTSVQTVTNAARLDMMERHPEVIEGIVWGATLDGRTTVICQSLDGNKWSLPDYKPIDHDQPFPGPTAHWNCRSNQYPVLASWDNLSKSHIKGLDKSIKEIPPSTRASMNGQVPSTLNYETWLRQQPVSFQQQVMGPARYNLWSSGKVTTRDLVTKSSQPLTVAEVKANLGASGTGPSVPITKARTPKTAINESVPISERNQIVRQEWEPELTREERTAVFNYTGNDYRRLNHLLRKDQPLDHYFANMHQDLQTALPKGVAWEGEVFRGLAFESRAELDSFIKLHQKGNTVTSPAFMSTSVDKGNISYFSRGGGYTAELRIESKRGTYLNGLSEHSGENEVLFGANTSFEVTLVRKAPANPDHIVINMRELP